MIDELNKRIFEKVVSGVVISSMYLITFSTIYYNAFDPTYHPIYHIISNVFGFSFGLVLIVGAYSFLFGLPSYVNVSLFTLLIYNVMNIAFSSLVMMDENIKFEQLQPTIEIFANLVFGTVCTYFYVKSYFKNG